MKIWSLLAVLAVTGCAEDVGKGKTAALVEDVPTASAPAPTADAVATETLAIDKSRSKLGALGAKITAKHPIVFHDYSGSVALAGQKVVGIAYEAEVATLTTDSDRLRGHLLKEDFLWAEQHPKSTFSSVEVREGSDAEGMTHTVVGDLTIRGKTKRVTFPARITVAGAEVSASASFVIDRQDFEVTYPGKADDLVQDSVLLEIELVAPRS